MNFKDTIDVFEDGSFIVTGTTVYIPNENTKLILNKIDHSMYIVDYDSGDYTQALMDMNTVSNALDIQSNMITMDIDDPTILMLFKMVLS